jgi:hypothetical protein
MLVAKVAVAFALLLQGVVAVAVAEQRQRTKLRAQAKRSKAAMPLITLPESLLLQDDSGGREDEARGRSSAGFLDSLRESAEDVVYDARQAFFAGGKKDPVAYAAASGITVDSAKSRIQLLGMIAHAQEDLMNRLQEAGLDLEATDARANYDLLALNQTANAAKTMPIMANSAEADVDSVQHNARELLDGVHNISNQTASNFDMIDKLQALKNATDPDYDKAKDLGSGQRRVQANSETMHALVPRLMQLQRHLARLESSLNDGNVSRMVDDAANQEVMNLVEDVSRAFGRFLRIKRTL